MGADEGIDERRHLAVFFEVDVPKVWEGNDGIDVDLETALDVAI